MNNNIEISEKEFAVISEIANNHQPDQRTIASKVGISLGLTNLIIRNLVTKGYIKAKQLNPRKIQYLLTAKGFGEKASKSYNYMTKTVNLINRTRRAIKDLILSEIEVGTKYIIVSPNNELNDIIELALINLNCEINLIKDEQANDINTVQFINADGKENRTLNLIVYLSELGLFHIY